MRNFLRFVLSSEDQTRIVPGSVVVEDIGFVQVSDPNAPPPQSLKLSFQIKPPENGGERQAPRINPLFPGTMRYIANPPESGALDYPKATNVDLVEQNMTGWPTKGMLSVFLADHNRVFDWMRRQVSPNVLPIIPNRAWYYPVKLSKEFLFETVAGPTGVGLTKRDILEGTPATVSPSCPIDYWRKSAIVHFLQGRYAPQTTLDEDDVLSADDIAAMAMPTVVMDDDGNVELYISMAYHLSTPQEGDQFDFLRMQPETSAGSTGPLSPSQRALVPQYVQNARIPARAVYQSFFTSASPGGGGSVIVNCTGTEALSQGIQSTCYYQTVRFTRSWTPTLDGVSIVEFSPHLARTKVLLRTATVSSVPEWEDYLPAHGWVFFPRNDTAPTTSPYLLSASMIEDRWIDEDGQRLNDMRWVKGVGASPDGNDDDLDGDGVGSDNWKAMGHKNSIPLILQGTGHYSPHIVLRRPMCEALFVESWKSGPNCTYQSLRRTIRALIDNRIAGGRYLKGQAIDTPSLAKRIIKVAWPGATPDVFDGKPDIGSASDDNFNVLLQVLQRIFGNAKGLRASDLWHSNLKAFEAEMQKQDYTISENFIGRGAPGALAYLGLAKMKSPPGISVYVDEKLRGQDESTLDPTPYVVNGELPVTPVQNSSEKMHSAMDPTLLTRGAVIQIWFNNTPSIPPHNKRLQEILTGGVLFKNDLGPPPRRTTVKKFPGHSGIYYDCIVNDDNKVSDILILDQMGPRRAYRVELFVPYDDRDIFSFKPIFIANWEE